MKKILTVLMTLMIVFSTLSISTLQVKAETIDDKIVSLPALAIHGGVDTWLLEVDEQVIQVDPGETFTINVKYQVWSESGPSIIRQAYFIASWTPSWPPPPGYYCPLYDGIPGTHPGITQTKAVTIEAPSDPGEYVLWFKGHAHYSMSQAIADEVGTRKDETIASKGHILVKVGPPPPAVGGKANPIDIQMINLELQIPWIWLTAIILPLLATVVYVKFKKKNNNLPFPFFLYSYTICNIRSSLEQTINEPVHSF